MSTTASIHLLRRVGHLEGTSFLILLGVAMPLKYFADLPAAVRIVGWAHGVLFVWLCVVLLRAKLAAGWGMQRAALVVVAALLPFGPFLIDRRLQHWRDESSGAGAP